MVKEVLFLRQLGEEQNLEIQRLQDNNSQWRQQIQHLKQRIFWRACGLPAEVPDLEHCGPGLRQRIALARAAYGTEALVLVDDPFAGFSNEEVDELFEIFHSRLFADRSCVVTFGGSAPQRALRRAKRPGLRFLVMEAGNLQAVQELPEFLNNEAFCCRSRHFDPRGASWARAVSFATATSTDAKIVEQGHMLAAAASPSWLLVLCLDQFFQILLDWWVISFALTPTLKLGAGAALAFFLAAVVHLSLKLLVAHLGARSYTAAALASFDTTTTAQGEREMDLQLPGQLWGLLAGSCGFFGLLGLSQLQLTQILASPWQLSLVPIYILALKALAAPGSAALVSTPLLDTLRRELQMGAAAKQEPGFQEHEDRLLASLADSQRRRPAMQVLLHLGFCLAAAYTVTAFLLLTNGASSKEALLTLAPFGMLLHFSIPWTESLKES
eukprot:s1977_g2.t1